MDSPGDWSKCEPLRSGAASGYIQCHDCGETIHEETAFTVADLGRLLEICEDCLKWRQREENANLRLDTMSGKSN